MAKRMLIDATHPEETRVVMTTGTRIEDFDFATSTKKQHKGNIYLAKITRVEPSLQAAFVEYGEGRQGFLPFAEIHPDYYQIPVADREKLLAEETGEDPGEEAPVEAPDSYSEEDAFPEESRSYEAEEAAVHEPREWQEHAGVKEASFEEDGPIIRGEESEDLPEGWQAGEPQPLEGEAEAYLAEPSPEAPSEEAAPEQDVETLADADEDAESRKRFRFLRRYRIQEVIKRGQIVLVQVLKEERGTKGASLTTYISLAGRYCVLMPNTLRSGGVSRKIANSEDRRRLKAVAERFELPKGMSIIIRTAGSDRSEDEIYRDYEYLVRLWDKIREDTLSSTAPALVHEEGDLIKRSIRDLYQSDVEEILVEGETAFESAREFMQTLMPTHTSKVKRYQSQVPLFHAFDVEDQLIGMVDPVVTLPSGAYIVINPTEALVSIDVNSGRATGERNIEETATKANLAAAAEIARQLRLRDLAGLIVIDFIDMNETRNKRAVERALKDALKHDRARIQLGRISAFGLLEMSRQRLRPSISEMNMVPCPHCEGTGLIRSTESMSLHILRSIEKEASSTRRDQIVLTTSSRVASYMLNIKRDSLDAVEKRYGVRVFVEVDDRLNHPGFKIESLYSSDGAYVLAEERKFAKATEQDDQRGRRRRRGRKGESPQESRPQQGRGRSQSFQEPDVAEEAESFAAHADAAEDQSRSGRRRRRGGRRRGESGQRAEAQDNQPILLDGDSFAGMLDDMPLPESEGQAENGEAAAHAEGEERRGRRRGRRGGRDRNRRRWKDREGQEGMDAAQGDGGSEEGEASPPNGHDGPDEAPRFGAQPAQEGVYAYDLPRAEPEKKARPRRRQSAQAPQESGETVILDASTPHDPNQPARRGWWRRILD